jgi:excisionase family DNA binding protein
MTGMSDNGNKPTQLMKVKEAMGYMAIGRTSLYGLIKAKKVKAFKRGGTTLIDRESIDQYQASLPPLVLNFSFFGPNIDQLAF